MSNKTLNAEIIKNTFGNCAVLEGDDRMNELSFIPELIDVLSEHGVDVKIYYDVYEPEKFMEVIKDKPHSIFVETTMVREEVEDMIATIKHLVEKGEWELRNVLFSFHNPMVQTLCESLGVNYYEFKFVNPDKTFEVE